MNTYTCPAFTVYEMPEGAVTFINEFTKVRVRFGNYMRYNTPRWDSVSFGSARSYARQYGEDEDAAEAETLANMIKFPYMGHTLYWVNKNAVSLTSHARPHETYIGLNFGDVVSFEGKLFELAPASNQNVKLVEI